MFSSEDFLGEFVESVPSLERFICTYAILCTWGRKILKLNKSQRQNFQCCWRDFSYSYGSLYCYTWESINKFPKIDKVIFYKAKRYYKSWYKSKRKLFLKFWEMLKWISIETFLTQLGTHNNFTYVFLHFHLFWTYASRVHFILSE